MTEQDWHKTERLDLMLDFAWGRMSERPRRLFACACVRVGWEAMDLDPARTAVEVSEAFADGHGTAADLRRVRQAVRAALDRMAQEVRGSWVGHEARHTAWCLAEAARRAATEKQLRNAVIQADQTFYFSALRNRAAQLPGLFRDVVGNLFRPDAPDPAWRTPSVVTLTRAAYAERDLPSGHLDATRLAVLADALEAAGATGEIVAHLRSPGPHVRGCWTVDLLLGKG
jgi:hypothetical protein